MQFIALFGELKKGEWPTFGAQHDYWEKAANFIQETARTNFKRSSKCSAFYFLYAVKYICSYVKNYNKQWWIQEFLKVGVVHYRSNLEHQWCGRRVMAPASGAIS